jgi:hypothetical protein
LPDPDLGFVVAEVKQTALVLAEMEDICVLWVAFFENGLGSGRTTRDMLEHLVLYKFRQLMPRDVN